ncbi:MAG: hotdog family protein [Pseudomonadota bacterium]
MNLPAIRSLVPHSGAMVLLDRVVFVDDEKLSAEVNITRDTVFFDGDGVAAWVGIEYMAQAIAAHAGYLSGLRGDPVKVGFLLGARRYECSRASFPLGSVLKISVQKILQAENGLGAFECRIDDSQDSTATAVALATITVFQPENVDDFLQGMLK